jgi:hypothetical protein
MKPQEVFNLKILVKVSELNPLFIVKVSGQGAIIIAKLGTLTILY